MSYFDQYVSKSPAIASRALGDETIVMSTVDSTLFTLNPTASIIWECADGITPLSRIIEERVCKEFDVPVEQARADAREFVDRLAAHGILRISDQPIAEPVP